MSIAIKRSPDTGALFVDNGDGVQQFDVRLNSVIATVPFATSDVNAAGAPSVIAPFLDVMLDKRAPGIYSAPFGGPGVKLERLAEMMVASGTVGEVARHLLRHDLINQVNGAILRANVRFKQGTVVMSYPMLFRTILEIVGASTKSTDPLRVVARVLTELLARVYSEFGVMMPYKTFYTQTYHENPIATTGAIIEAAYVATVTETLDVLRLGGAMREKEFTAAVVETVLGPNLVNAANKLLAAERYNRWMKDAALLTGMALMNVQDPAVEALRDDGNLQLLMTNASWAISACGMVAHNNVISPAHEHVELLQYATLRIRELRRFETVSIEKFKNMYSVQQIKTARGRLAGAFVARNSDVKAVMKTAVLHEDMDIIIPMPAIEIDPYMPMLNDITNAAYAGDVSRNAAAAFAQYYIARSNELDEANTQVVFFGLTPSEQDMLAIAHSKQLLIAANPFGFGAVVYHGMRAGQSFYDAQGVYDGDHVWTTSVPEVFVLLDGDFAGTQRFVTRPQTFEDGMFSGLLDAVNPALYDTATRQVGIQIPLPDGTVLKTALSLYNLVTGQQTVPTLRHYVAVDRQIRDAVSSMFALGIYCQNELAQQSGSTDKLMAEQIATGIHDVLSRYVKPVGFTRFMRTLNAYLVTAAALPPATSRQMLTNVVAKHAMAIRLAGALMVRTGVIPFGLQEDLITVLSTSSAIERAAASEAFNNALITTLRD